MRSFVCATVAALLIPGVSLAQSKWGGDAAGVPRSKATAPTTGTSGNRPPPPPPASSSAPSSGGATPPPRPPGQGLQAIDPLVTEYSFRGINMTHEIRNVSLYLGEQTIIFMHQEVGVVSMRIKSKPYTGPLPKGAYTVGIEVSTAGCNAEAHETIEIVSITRGGDSVVQSCPVTTGVQRCVGFSTDVSLSDNRLFELKVRAGSKQCPAPELKKILMDVPI